MGKAICAKKAAELENRYRVGKPQSVLHSDRWDSRFIVEQELQNGWQA